MDVGGEKVFLTSQFAQISPTPVHPGFILVRVSFPSRLVEGEAEQNVCFTAQTTSLHTHALFRQPVEDVVNVMSTITLTLDTK